MLLVFQRKSDGRRALRAFTLVELIVVVAITAILASLLLPALTGAREKSRRAVCKSNLRQVLFGLGSYANDYSENLPSAQDNAGYYHSIRLSDAVFTNFVDEYLSGVSNVFYCPNFDFDGMTLHDKYGYVIGYSYLANAIIGSAKGPDYWVAVTKLNGPPTNALIADANFWSAEAVMPSGATVQLAPHTAMGANMSLPAVASNRSVTSLPNNQAQAMGAMGGNIGRADMSVTWKSIENMGEYQASSTGESWGNW